MAHLQTLPDELLVRAISFLDRNGLAQTRLVSKRLEQIAVEKLFERVTLYAHRLQCAEDEDLENIYELSENVSTTDAQESDNGWRAETPDYRLQTPRDASQWDDDSPVRIPRYDARAFINILQHPVLKILVKTVQVYTCETHCDYHPRLQATWFKDYWSSVDYDPAYYECVKRLTEFPNVRAIIVHFDRHAKNYGLNDILQDADFQRNWLRRILHPLNDRITEIGIRHYENFQPWDPKAPSLAEDIAQATSLRMSIKHGETHLDFGPVYRVGNIHPFWNSFPDQYLKPLESSLRTLVLYSDLPFGWFPKLDLRSVHLPMLRSLTLGHHVFYNNHQLDWIVSHGTTLKELHLDRCAILYQIGYAIPGWLNDEGYPNAQILGYAADYGWSADPQYNPEHFSSDLQFRSFGTRWFDIFFRFADALVQLHTFRFGSSRQWKLDTKSRYDDDHIALPIIPWEDEENIENHILEERYVIWDDWEMQYRPHWTMETDDHLKSEDYGWRREWLARLEKYPDCKEDDEAALRALLTKIGML